MGLINYFTKSRGEKSADECCRIARENIKEAEKLRKREFEKRIAAKDFRVGDIVDIDDLYIEMGNGERKLFKHCGRCEITSLYVMNNIDMVAVEGCFEVIPYESDTKVGYIFAMPKSVLTARWELNNRGC